MNEVTLAIDSIAAGSTMAPVAASATYLSCGSQRSIGEAIGKIRKNHRNSSAVAWIATVRKPLASAATAVGSASGSSVNAPASARNMRLPTNARLSSGFSRPSMSAAASAASGMTTVHPKMSRSVVPLPSGSGRTSSCSRRFPSAGRRT